MQNWNVAHKDYVTYLGNFKLQQGIKNMVVWLCIATPYRELREEKKIDKSFCIRFT